MICGQWRYTVRSPSSLDSNSDSFEPLVVEPAHGCPPVAVATIPWTVLLYQGVRFAALFRSQCSYVNGPERTLDEPFPVHGIGE